MLGVVTVTVAVEELLAETGSGVVETTTAVLTTDPYPPLGLVTTSVIVVEPPESIVPREQVTVPKLAEQGDVAETNVVPAGRRSVTVTAAAEAGPKFLTRML